MRAIVLQITDLAKLLPPLSREGRIGVDVRVVAGAMSVGKHVRLECATSSEEIEVVAIEMLSDLREPGVVRVHCTTPRSMDSPLGRVNGWTIVEA
jgi:hypothetical protein